MNRCLRFSWLFAFGITIAVHGFELRPLSNQQIINDLWQAYDLIDDYYGPLEMKEKNGKFQLKALFEETEAEIRKAKTESEALGALARAMGKLNDGHVSIKFPQYASRPGQVTIPLFLTPVENRAIVAHVEDSAKSLGIEVGDEVLSIDGTPAMKFAEIASKYLSFGNKRSNQHLLLFATYRPTYMTELVPDKPEARVEVKKTNGKTYPISVIWRPKSLHEKKVLFVEPPQGSHGNFVAPMKEIFNSVATGSYLAMGSNTPFFATPQNEKALNLTEVYANDKSLAQFGLKREDTPAIFAAMYRYNNRNVLLIRQPTYNIDKFQPYIQHYKAILQQYEPFTDVLVIDQTHNPGGKTLYLEAFFRLFIADKSKSVVQFMRADRKWVSTLERWAREIDPDLESESSRQLLLRAKMVEDANNRGDFFIPNPIPTNQDPEVFPDPQYTWKKPLAILTDELAGSCGDLFPMLMKEVGFKTFGQPTMGLGGSVEDVGELTHSGAVLKLTRGLFTIYNPEEKYGEDDYVENTGVPVDESYSHTVEDFRAGFVKYLEAASKFAVSQIK